MRLGPTRAYGLRRAAAAVAVSILVSGTFAGAALAQSTSPSPKQETTFTWADTSEPSSLNPLVGYLGTDYTFWAINYNLPIEFGTKDFAPDYQHSIVTSVDPSSDGMTFTYHMRSGLKWSDGQPFTANDVAWTLNFYKKYNVSNYSSDLLLVDHVTATDDTTFVITASKPTSFYSGKSVFLYEYILPEHIWGKYENDYKGAKQVKNAPSVGSGPYIITDYKQGQSVTLERNPYYWGTSAGLTPHYDKLVYVIYNNEDAEAAALQNGEIDFAYIDSANILTTLKGKPNVATRGAIVPSFEELAINTSWGQTDPAGGYKPHGDAAHALSDPVVRRAIRQAIDDQTIVDKVLLGYGAPADSPVQPSATTGDWNPSSSEALNFDIAKANQELDAAGYQMGSDGVRIDPFNNEPLEFRYFARNSDQNTIDTAPFVKDWLAQIGIKLDITSVSNGKLGGPILEDSTYDMYDWGWYPNPDPNYILGIFTCGQRPSAPGVYGNNDSYYCNPDYDKLYREQATTTDAAQRADIVHQMQEILYRDQPYIMLYYNAVLEAYRTDRVTGFSPQPADNGSVKGDLLATYGPLSFISIRPATATAGTASGTKGISAGVWIGILLAVIVVLGGVVLLRRRRVDDEDRA